jgi:hypothetical protein
MAIDLKQLYDALRDAFPTSGDLTRMVLFGLNENLDGIAGGQNLDEVTLNLVRWAKAQGRLDDLLQAAQQANPHNPLLQAWAAPAVPTPTPATGDDIPLTIGVNNDGPSDGAGEGGNRPPGAPADPQTLTYQVTMLADRLQIQPQLGYLALLAAGGPIQGISRKGSPFEWQFPNLDLKLVNNSAKTLFFTEAVFAIEQSLRDPWPILVIRESRGNIMHFRLANEGWGPVQQCTVRYNLAPPATVLAFGGPYAYTATIGDFTDDYNVDVTEGLRALGADVDTLRRQADVYAHSGAPPEPQLVGPFTNGEALAYGAITYTGQRADGAQKTSMVTFSTIVSLVPPGAHMPMPPSYQYEARFEVGKDHYEVRVPLSQVVKAGEADRFDLRIGAEQSSQHTFRLTLLYNNGQHLTVPPIALAIFVPRSSSSDIRDTHP